MDKTIKELVDILAAHLDSELITDDNLAAVAYDHGYYSCKLEFNIPADKQDKEALEWYKNIIFLGY